MGSLLSCCFGRGGHKKSKTSDEDVHLEQPEAKTPPTKSEGGYVTEDFRPYLTGSLSLEDSGEPLVGGRLLPYEIGAERNDFFKVKTFQLRGGDGVPGGGQGAVGGQGGGAAGGSSVSS